MANVDLKYSTIIGTPEVIMRLLGLLGGAANVDAKFCNLVALDKSPNERQLAKAFEATPRRQR